MVIIVGTLGFCQKAMGIWKEHRLCGQADMGLNSAVLLTISLQVSTSHRPSVSSSGAWRFSFFLLRVMESKSKAQHSRRVADAGGRALAVRQVLSSEVTDNKLLGPLHDGISILHTRKLRHRKVKHVEHVGTEIQIRIRELKSLLPQLP